MLPTPNARKPLEAMEFGCLRYPFLRERLIPHYSCAVIQIPHLTAFAILLFCVRCFNKQRLSRVAKGTGPLKPQQPDANAKVLIPAQVGRDKILD
jgi:hypothetical protein